ILQMTETINSQAEMNSLYSKILRPAQQFLQPFVLQKTYDELDRALFYVVEVQQLPNGVQSWMSFIFFTDDNVFVGTPHLFSHISQYNLHILNMFKVWHRGYPAEHYVIIFADGQFVCDCAMPMNLGIPCHHLYAIWTHVSAVRFNL
ncbi:hypothetical protein CYLTODRAFT_322716, partial [Cylindrobasidium torrendii FP15055 ss-10]